jgi:hypothetical protein
MRDQASVLALVVGLWACLAGGDALADVDCSPERLALVFPEVRTQYELLRDGGDASILWSPADESALREMRSCPDAIGRRAAFYYAITRLIRGDLDEVRGVVETLSRATVSEPERRQLDELMDVIVRVEASRSEVGRANKSTARAPANAGRTVAGTVLALGATGAAVGSGVGFARLTTTRKEAASSLHTTAETDSLIVQGNGQLGAGVALAIGALVAGSAAAATFALPDPKGRGVAVLPLPLPGGMGLAVGGRW